MSASMNDDNRIEWNGSVSPSSRATHHCCPPAPSSWACARAAVHHGGHGCLRLQLDADGDGRISPPELAAVSHAITPPPSKSAGGREVGVMMEELDADREDLGEFASFHGRGRGERDLDAELRAAFDVYNINGDGHISMAELSKLLGHVRGVQEDNVPYSPASVPEIFPDAKEHTAGGTPT
ncbi:hypothetical protein QYE76_003462 [Lolium multiflorum]|uniref:EF-hand domain-containing protein n=1 Tax=Lolium multiflorum TaxID=4521 RepID=A0AAD8VZ93_LOLMU|nr:hypothetical protein QYE76_003462 [Lolium multiflorum]